MPACTREGLAARALVASDPRTAGAVVITAPMPPRLIDRSYATPSLIAHIASDKFCDGLPLHRQEDRFARLGVPIDIPVPLPTMPATNPVVDSASTAAP